MSPVGRLGTDRASRHPLGLSSLGKCCLPSLGWTLHLASTPHTSSSSSQGDGYNTWARQHGTPSRTQNIIKPGMNLILDSWARAWSKVGRETIILWCFMSISLNTSAGGLRYSLRTNLTITVRVKAWAGITWWAALVGEMTWRQGSMVEGAVWNPNLGSSLDLTLSPETLGKLLNSENLDPRRLL